MSRHTFLCYYITSSQGEAGRADLAEDDVQLSKYASVVVIGASLQLYRIICYES